MFAEDLRLRLTIFQRSKTDGGQVTSKVTIATRASGVSDIGVN